MAINPGDIAFSAFQADNTGGGFNGDAFEFVLLVPVTAGTTIYFTDNGYLTGSSTFRTNENLVRWVAQTDLPAGTIRTFTAPAGTGAASTAEWTGINPTTGAALAAAAFGLAGGGDNITALINPTFGGADALNGTAIAAITFGGATFAATFTTTSGNATTALAPGLTDGVNAVSLAGTDNGRYNDAAAGSVESGTQAVVSASLNNDAYWTTSTTPLAPHNTTATFAIASATPTVNLSVSLSAGSEAGQTVITVTATASSAVTGDQTVSLGVSGTNITAGDYTLSAPTITILSGQTSGSVTFTVVDDAVVESTETTVLMISNPSSGLVLGTATSQSITITDNDVAVNATPTIQENTATPFVNLATTGSGAVSGVLNDPTDPASTLGLDFAIADTDTPVDNLTVTVTSSNQTVVSNANLVLSGTGATRNLKINPSGVGLADLTVTVSDGNTSSVYTINYAASAGALTPTTTRFLTGVSDASTAVAIDSTYMFVADDENQVIRLYDRTNSGLAIAGFDFTSSLGLTDISGGAPREVDIEASVQVGNTIYWMGSHSNSAGGADRPNRERIFATTIAGTGAATTLTYAGRYDFLAADLFAWDAANGNALGLAASAATGIVPELTNGFNIEGLTIAPDGTTAYVAFRAPNEPTTSRDRALIIPVTNFTTILSPTGGTAGSATFGAPIQLDLGGRGIREIKRSASGDYLIIAGPAGPVTGTAPADFRLYTWMGNAVDAPVLRSADLTALLAGGSFESIVELPGTLTDTSQIQLLVDNGDTDFYNTATAAKDLAQNNFKKFRSEVVTLGAAVQTTATVTIAATDANAAEAGTDPGTFRITRTGSTTSDLTVNYAIATGTGQATSADYTSSLTGTATIPTGSSFVDITITPVDDTAVEGTETVALTLASGAGYAIGASNAATVTIIDNDTSSAPPQLVPGDVIFNEYASDNDANGNDFFELLVLKDGADLRGLRVSDNEIVSGVLNSGESVLVFGNDAFLSNVPKGTIIAVYTTPTGITTDTVVNPAANDWKMVLAPGTGVTLSADGLGGATNAGLSTGGEALYLYLPGADGTSAGTDNQYLDFISFEADAGDPPAGFADINLPSVADNAYYTGNTAIGNNVASNWVTYDFPSTLTTPGDANPGQDLSNLRTLVATPGLTITQSGGNTSVVEGGTSDSYSVALNTQPTADVIVTLANPGAPTQLALTPTTLTFTAANWNTPQTVTVTAVDDTLVEGLHSSTIISAIASSDTTYDGLSIAPLTVSIVDNDVTVTKIHDIQGIGTTFNSAFGGTQTIEGIVVAAFQGSTRLNGFYVQEEDADADTDAATSEGIFVFDPTGLFSGSVGSKVRITGTVGEFTTTSTSIAGSANSSLTQLSSLSSVVNLGTFALPTVTNVVLPVADAAVLERYEGMLVNVSAATGPLTVTETFKLGRFGQVGLSTDGRIDNYTQVNAPSVSGYTNYVANLLDNYIILDDGSGSQNPDPTIHARGGQPLSATNTLRGGDTIASISGVLDQRFEGYRVQTTTPANFQPTNAREATAPVVGGTLRVASANLLNFFNGNGLDANNDGLIDGGFPTSRGADTAIEFKRQIDKTVQEVLGLNADVFGYNEMENDGYGSASAVQQLVNALNAATAPGTYAFVIPPASALNATGGLGGDEITVGFIYKTNAVRIAPGTEAAALTTGIFAQDTANRVQRPALAVTFERLANGTPTNETFTAVINHFKSKGSAANLPGDADQGDGQGLSNATRTAASQQLAAWLATNPTGTADPDYLILGDLNSYRLEDPITTLTNAGYNSLFGPESYSYQFNGQWGSLDHALASGSLASQVTGAAKWHINSDEPIVLDYNTEFKSAGQVSSFYNVDPFRTSDHDPIVVGLNLSAPDTTPPVAPTVTLTSDTGVSNSDRITQIGTLTLTNIEANALVQYSINGGTTWTNSFTAVQGVNTVQVRQTDAAGNVSPVTALTFTLDTEAAAPGVALTSDTGASNTDGITRIGTLAVTSTEDNALVEYSINGGTSWTTSFTATQGANTVQVRQTDVAGNVSSVTPLTFTLDTVATAPGVALTSDTGVSNSDGVTQIGTLTVTGTEDNALVEYSIDGTTWTNSFTAVQGANSVQVRQTDVAGNVSSATTLSFTLDTVAPTALSVALTSDTGNSNSDLVTQVGTLAIASAEANALVEYSIDGTTWTNSFTAAQGVNTVQVRQTDVAGNVSLATPLTFTLDTVAPTALGVALTSDTGASNSDRITQIGTLAIAGAEANALVEYSIDGTTWTNSFTAAQGVNTVQVRQTDVAGNVSVPTTLAFTLDTTVAAPTLALAVDSGISNSDKLTNSGVVNVNGLETGASWQYSTNSGTTWITGAGNSLTLTGDGAKNVVVRQTDLAGNVSGISAPLTFTLDTVAPTKTVAIASMTKDTGTTTTDFITSDGTAGRTYSGTLSAALLAASENLQVSVDGGTTWNLATVNNTSWTFVDNTAKTSNWTVLARVVDTAGNAAPTASRSVTLDQQTPAATSVILDLTTASDSGVSNTDNLTNVARPTFAISFDSTKAQVGDIVQVINSNNIVFGSTTLTAAQVSAGTANVTLSAATPLSSGLNTLSVLYRDVTGNSIVSASSLDVTYDNQVSVASAVTLDLLAASDSGVSSSDNITNVTLPTFAVTFDSTRTQVGDVIEVRRGGTVLGTTTLDTTQANAGTVNVTLTTALNNGANTLSAVHRDAAGNTVTGTPTLIVTRDTTAPNAPIATGYTTTSVNGTAEANAIVQFSTSASAPTSFVGSATATSGNYTLDTTSLVGANTGTTYYLYAQDVAGNVGSASSQRIVVGTAGNDLLTNVGGSGSDLLIGGSGTDTVQYAVASNAIALTGQISAATGSINIRTANIDVLTGMEQLNFTGTGYTGIGTGTNQLRSSIQSALGNNSVAAFTGVYESLSGSFSFGVANPNATLLVFDSNPGTAQNREAFLLLGKTTPSGSIDLVGGTVSLTNL